MSKKKFDISKGASWFRMYAEFATDPKVQMLSEADQRRFLMLLCLRCSNGDVTLHETQIAFQLRISIEDWRRTCNTLVTAKLVTLDGLPVSWEKRQFASDSSRERVRKHREKNKKESNGDVTLQERLSNAPETETETEKEKDLKQPPKPPLVASLPSDGEKPTSQTKPTSKPTDFDSFWSAYPTKVGKEAARKAWGKAKLKPPLETILTAISKQKTSQRWTKAVVSTSQTPRRGSTKGGGLTKSRRHLSEVLPARME